MTFWTRIEQFFKHSLLKRLEKSWGRSILDPSYIDQDKIQRILVIRQHDQLGDLLLSTPVFGALRAHFPGAHITAIVRSYTKTLLKYHPHIDRVLTFHENILQWTPGITYKFWRTLRSGYDLTIVLNTVSHSMSSDTMAALSRAPFVLGSEYKPFKGCKRNFFYNLIAPYDHKEKHQSERNMDIVRFIGADRNDYREMIGLIREEKEDAKSQLWSLINETRGPVLGIHPGAGKSENRWPVKRFAQVADIMATNANMNVILFYGKHEKDLVHQLKSHMKCNCVLSPRISLRNLAALISQLDLFLCNDTGVLHVAASVDTPLVAMFGPTDPKLWKPRGERFIAIRGKNNTVESISTEEVLKAGVELINKQGFKGEK